jgi:hypothetical protein
MLTILDAIRDADLFAPWFRKWETWRAWRVVLQAISGLPMSEEDLAGNRDYSATRLCWSIGIGGHAMTP